MDGLRDHIKWSKPDRKINILWYHLYADLKNNYTNEFIYKTERESQTIENKLMVTKREKAGGGIHQDLGNNRYTLFHIKWISNKVLLYSTGNYTQNFIKIYSGKISEKYITYICNSFIVSYIWSRITSYTGN